jgi:hypothetical protein
LLVDYNRYLDRNYCGLYILHIWLYAFFKFLLY